MSVTAAACACSVAPPTRGAGEQLSADQLSQLQQKVATTVKSISGWPQELSTSLDQSSLVTFTRALPTHMAYARRLYHLILDHKASKHGLPREPSVERQQDEEDSTANRETIDEAKLGQIASLYSEATLGKGEGLFKELFTLLYALSIHTTTMRSNTVTQLNCDKQKHTFDRLKVRESHLYVHYSNKIAALKQLSLLQETTSINDPGDHPPIVVTRIRNHQLYNEQTQPILDPLLALVSSIAAIKDKVSIARTRMERRMAIYTRALDQFTAALLQLKSQKLYATEIHAQRHLEKSALLNRLQQGRLYVQPNPKWDQTLNPDIYEVDTQAQVCCHYPYAVSKSQGKRKSMEDREDVCTIRVRKHLLPLFAVMDGHVVEDAAQHCKIHLANIFSEELERHNADGFTVHGICNAARRTCLRLHEEITFAGGTTLLFATIIDHTLYIFSVGDSRALLIGENDVLALSCDARANDDEFRNKVIRYGAFISGSPGHYRVGELGLEMTTSIGDRSHDPYFTRYPLITAYPLPQRGPAPLLMLFTDGLPEVASDKQIFEEVKRLQSQSQPLSTISQWLVERALRSSADNITLIAVNLVHHD